MDGIPLLATVDTNFFSFIFWSKYRIGKFSWCNVFKIHFWPCCFLVSFMTYISMRYPKYGIVKSDKEICNFFTVHSKIVWQNRSYCMSIVRIIMSCGDDCLTTPRVDVHTLSDYLKPELTVLGINFVTILFHGFCFWYYFLYIFYIKCQYDYVLLFLND